MASPRQARAHYAKAYEPPLALHTGFEWYRSLEQDERDNVQTRDHKVHTPVLYLRGQREPGLVDDYLKGLRAAGLQNVRGGLVNDAGHYAPDEQPGAVAEAIGRFIGAIPAAVAREGHRARSIARPAECRRGPPVRYDATPRR